jgi:hypothetical protein
MNGLIRTLIRKAGLKWLTGQVRAAAEGKLGERWYNLYWALAGKKRWLALGCVIVSGVLSGLGYQTAAEASVAVAGVLVSLGFVDANWRAEAQSDWLKDSVLWKFLAHNSPALTATLLAAYAWLGGSTCTLGEWCARGTVAVTVLGAVFVQVGLVDAAWNAEPPKE